jgi:predicted metal-dependent phosphoesterase TrpH
MRIDLHTHSTCSDGTDTPAQLVARAAQHLDVVAITDHDTTHGWAEAMAAAEHHGIRVVRGIEISARNRGPGQHLLGYRFDPAHPPLAQMLARGVEGRNGRIPAILARLSRIGLELDERDVRAATEESGGTIGRPHIAATMVAKGYVPDIATAFDHYLNPGKPGYVERYAPDVEEAIETIRDAGGVSVLAHPCGNRGKVSAERLGELAAAGLTGVEVDHEEHSAATRAELRGTAAELGLVVTGGSDYHGANKVGHELGCNLTAPDQLDALLDG